MPDVRFKAFAHLKEALGFELPLDCALPGKIVSLPLLPASVWAFPLSFPRCVGVAQLVFRIFFRQNCSICHYRFGVFIEEGKF